MKYESMVIFRESLSDDDLEKEQEKLKETIVKAEGEVVDMDFWGKRKLAYPIQKCEYGYYIVSHFLMEATNITQINRYYKFNENIIRFNILNQDI